MDLQVGGCHVWSMGGLEPTLRTSLYRRCGSDDTIDRFELKQDEESIDRWMVIKK